MSRFLVVYFLMLCGLLSGCASGTKYPDMTLPPIPAGQGRMILYRDAIPIGLGVQPEVKVNQVKVCLSQPNGFCFVDRVPGSYDVTCMTEWEHKITVVVVAGEVR
jgi:hypothetical protein